MCYFKKYLTKCNKQCYRLAEGKKYFPVTGMPFDSFKGHITLG